MPKLDKSNVGSVVTVPPFWKDRVIERVIEASLEDSKSSGKPQIKMTTEIVMPESVKIGEVEYILAGQKINRYLGLSTDITGNAKQSPWSNTFAFLDKLGLPTEIDTDDPELNKKVETMLTGICFENILNSSERIPKKRGLDGKFTPILDARGLPIKQGFEWNTFLNDVVGRAEADVNKPY